MRRVRLNFSLENLSEKSPVAAPEDLATGAIKTTDSDLPENEFLSMQKAEKMLDSSIKEYDGALDVVEALSKSVKNAEQSFENDGEGLSECDAKVLDIVVESLCQRLDIPYGIRPVFALEAFSSPSSRKDATRLALEEIKEVVLKILRAIMDGIKASFVWLIRFVDSLIDGAAQLKRRADSIAHAAQAVESSPDSVTVTSTMFQALRFKNQMPNADVLIGRIEKEANGETPADLAMSISSAVAAYENMIAVVKKGEDPEAAKKVLYSLIKQVMASSKDASSSTKVPDAPEGMVLLETRIDGTDYSCYSQVPRVEDGPESFMAIAGKVKTFVAVAGGAQEEVQVPQAVEGLRKELVIRLASAVSKEMAAYAKAGDALSKIKTSLSRLEQQMSNLNRDAGIGEGQALLLSKLTQSFRQIVTTGLTSRRSFEMKYATAALDYCNASLSGQKKEAQSV